MEVDVKYDQGEVYRGTVLDVKKPNGEHDKAEVVIRFGDPRNNLVEGEDDPFVLPDPDVTIPAKGYFACCDCGLTRKTRGAECTGELCVYGVYGTSDEDEDSDEEDDIKSVHSDDEDYVPPRPVNKADTPSLSAAVDADEQEGEDNEVEDRGAGSEVACEGDKTPPYTGPVLNRTMAENDNSGSPFTFQKQPLDVWEAAVSSFLQLNEHTKAIVAIGVTLDLSKGFGKRKARYADHARDGLVIFRAGTQALSQLGSKPGLQQVAKLANELIDSQPWGKKAGFRRKRYAVDSQIIHLARAWDAREMARIKAELDRAREEGQDVATDLEQARDVNGVLDEQLAEYMQYEARFKATEILLQELQAEKAQLEVQKGALAAAYVDLAKAFVSTMDDLDKKGIKLDSLPGIAAPRILAIRDGGRNGGSPAAGSSRFSPASDSDSGNDEDEADEVGQGAMAGACAAEGQGSGSRKRPREGSE